ncbi:hypothetical protein [Microbulbifer yueqingensis]|nr:hypothetical protein [Microbulbifer yueqingensis]
MRYLKLIPAIFLLAPTLHAEPLPDMLRECAAIKADDERLQCYDELSGTLDELAKRNFGKEHEAATGEAPESLVTTIEKMEESAYGKQFFYLENGQVWKQTDSKFVSLKAGDRVELDRGLLGSFFMRNANGGKSIRVKRVR